MEFTIKIDKKDLIIAILTILLVVVTVSKIQMNDKPKPVSSQGHFGMADEDINYTIIYDQVNDASVVYAELFGDDDTIQIEDSYYVKIDSCVALNLKMKTHMTDAMFKMSQRRKKIEKHLEM